MPLSICLVLFQFGNKGGNGGFDDFGGGFDSGGAGGFNSNVGGGFSNDAAEEEWD